MTDPTTPDEGAPFDTDVPVVRRALAEVSAIKARKETTALAIRQVNAVQASFQKAADRIQALAEKHKDVIYDVSTTQGLDDAKAARAEIRKVRYDVQNGEKEAKSTLNTLKGVIVDRAAELVAMIEPIEEPVHKQIEREEKRRAEEKAERERKAAEERAAIQARIGSISQFGIVPHGLSSVGIEDRRLLLAAIDITLDEYGDRAGEAEQAKQHALAHLVLMRDAAKAQEDAAAELAKQREELRQQRAAEEARQAQARKEEAARLEAQRIENKATEERLRAQSEHLAKLRKAIEDEQAAAQRQKDDDAAAIAKAAADAAPAAAPAAVPKVEDFAIFEDAPSGYIYTPIGIDAVPFGEVEDAEIYWMEIAGPVLYAAAKEVQREVRAFLPQVVFVLPTSFGLAVTKLNAAIAMADSHKSPIKGNT